MKASDIVLGVVGPCAAGKSTLVDQLKSRGYQARHIAQEHSYVQEMWAVIANPDILIYLDVSYEVSCKRNQSTWSRKIFDDQIDRLAHARENAHLIVKTDQRSPAEVLDLVLRHIESDKE